MSVSPLALGLFINDFSTFLGFLYPLSSGNLRSPLLLYRHWRPTKVETTGATLNYETLISRLFETFLDFETKKQVVPRHAGTP